MSHAEDIYQQRILEELRGVTREECLRILRSTIATVEADVTRDDRIIKSPKLTKVVRRTRQE